MSTTQKKYTKKVKDKVILVVEDERPLLKAIQEKLELHGFDVVTARSVKQALGYLEDIKKIDIIWLDHYLFGTGSGLDFLAQVKQKTQWKRIPVFVVSNTAGPDKKRAYLELGAKEYFIKAEHRLEDIIRAILKYF